MAKKTLPPILQNPQSDGSSFDWHTSSDTGVVCLHGFTATTVEVRKFASLLNQQGYNVSGPLLPGHGTSPEDMNKVSWKDWLRITEDYYLAMKSRCKRVFLAGESTGALLSLLLASKYPNIDGLLIFAPALKIPGIWLTRLIWPFKKYVYKKNFDLTSPWQGFNVIPLHGASELAKLQEITRRSLAKVTTPLIVFQGKLDRTIDPISAIEVLENVKSRDKELVWLENSPHVILLEGPLEDVFELSQNFISSHP